MHIEFVARKGKNEVRANSAKLAVLGFLERFKNRSFIVTEYRDGTFRCSVMASDPDKKDDCFWMSFKSRKEAMDFCRAMQG